MKTEDRQKREDRSQTLNLSVPHSGTVYHLTSDLWRTP